MRFRRFLIDEKIPKYKFDNQFRNNFNQEESQKHIANPYTVCKSKILLKHIQVSFLTDFDYCDTFLVQCFMP